MQKTANQKAQALVLEPPWAFQAASFVHLRRAFALSTLPAVVKGQLRKEINGEQKPKKTL